MSSAAQNTTQQWDDDLIERFVTRLKRLKGEDHSTYKLYRRALECYDDWLTLQNLTALDATTLDVEDHLLEMKQDGYAGNTIEIHLTAIRKLYTTAEDKFELIDDHPCEEFDVDELGIHDSRDDDDRIYYVTKDEFDHMCENCGTPYVRNRLVLELLWQTGMRKNELSGIELDEVDIDNHRIRVYGSKTSEWRTVHYQPSLNRLMNIWIEQERPLMRDSPYLFPTNRSEQISAKMISKIVRGAAEDVNEIVGTTHNGNSRRRITVHSLRHGHAVHALKSGVDVRSVQTQLGHKKLDTTMQYLRLIEDDVAEAYQSFS